MGAACAGTDDTPRSASGAPSSVQLASDGPTERLPKRWPNARNTGAHGDLREISGRDIRTDDFVLKNVYVNGQLTIHSDNVTLENVHVKTDSYYGILLWGSNARIRRTTIEGTPGNTLAGLAAYEGGSFNARRLNVFGSEDGVRLADDSVLARSYVHDLGGTSESHFDSVTADGYQGWRIVGNTILNQHDQTAAVWVGDPRYEPSSGLLKGNLIAGGGYSIYGGPGIGRGIRVVDNFFSTRFNRRGGYYGPVAHWSWRNNSWNGNTWADGPRAGAKVTP